MAKWLRLGSRTFLLLLLFGWTMAGTGEAAEKVQGILTVITRSASRPNLAGRLLGEVPHGAALACTCL